MGQSCPGLWGGLTCVLPAVRGRQGRAGVGASPHWAWGRLTTRNPDSWVCLVLRVDIAEDLCPHTTPKTHKHGVPGWDRYFRRAQ